MFNEQRDDTFLARWLNDELSEEELKEFQASEEYVHYQKIKAGSEMLMSPEFDENQMLSNIKTSTETKPKGISRRIWLYGVAASISILIGYFVFTREQIETYNTPIGQQVSIELPDGSEMTLNAKSTASFDENNWSSSRKIALDGEAYFKVVKGEKFTVETANGSISVLGTQFNVNSENGYFEVTCYEGSVSVSSESDNHVLKAGDSFRRMNGSGELSKLEDQAPSWLSDVSTFKSVPVKYVIKALEKQFGLTFKGKLPGSDVLFTGSFPHTDQELALKLVFGSLEISYKFESEKIVVLDD